MKYAISLSFVLLVVFASSAFGQDFGEFSEVLAFGEVTQVSGESVTIACARFKRVPQERSYTATLMEDGKERREQRVRMIEVPKRIARELKLSTKDFVFEKSGQAMMTDRRLVVVPPQQLKTGTRVIVFGNLDSTQADLYRQFFFDRVVMAVKKKDAGNAGSGASSTAKEVMPPVPAEN